MKKLILVLGALALSACVSHNFREGERIAWRCDGDKAFSLRMIGDDPEIYAAGQTHRLTPIAGETRRYSNGEITYARDGARARLDGVYGGPYENCLRAGGLRLW